MLSAHRRANNASIYWYTGINHLCAMDRIIKYCSQRDLTTSYSHMCNLFPQRITAGIPKAPDWMKSWESPLLHQDYAQGELVKTG